MNYKQEEIKKEQQQIIGIIPSMDMKNFVTLLLADLASKSFIYYYDGRDTKTAVLSADYKRIIEDIMYQENGWGIKFTELIDTYFYYEYQLDWEQKLGNTISEVLEGLNKNFRYDIENNIIEVDFTEEEITTIKSNYDEQALETMDHFSNLVNSYVFSRKYKLDRKEIDRSESRFKHHLEELQKRAVYANKLKIKIAKPIIKNKIFMKTKYLNTLIKKVSNIRWK